MAFTYDPSTDRGKVRLLCTDVSETYAIFTDAEIDAFLELENGSVRLAASQALNQIASSQVLVMKVITMLDLQTDGAKMADSLRASAAALRTQEMEVSGFDIAEQVFNGWGADERLYKQMQRGSF